MSCAAPGLLLYFTLGFSFTHPLILPMHTHSLFLMHIHSPSLTKPYTHTPSLPYSTTHTHTSNKTTITTTTSLLTNTTKQKVHAALGIKHTIISGGGSLASHLDLFYEAVGLTVLNGWGLTETSPVLACRRWAASVCVCCW